MKKIWQNVYGRKLEGVKWIYANDWYDWVLSGACEYQGKRYYAYMIDESRDKKKKWYRKYLIVDLPEDIWKEELEKHAFFVEKVGNHFDFDGDQRVGSSGQKHSDTWKEFYDKYPPHVDMDYSNYPYVGWFEN